MKQVADGVYMNRAEYDEYVTAQRGPDFKAWMQEHGIAIGTRQAKRYFCIDDMTAEERTAAGV
jgi:hypothetical protein